MLNSNNSVYLNLGYGCRDKHGLSLAFGSKIFEETNHLIILSIRRRDGEECFKIIGMVRRKLFCRRVHLAERLPPVHFCRKERQR